MKENRKNRDNASYFHFLGLPGDHAFRRLLHLSSNAIEENGFTIAKLKAQGEENLVTVAGTLPRINPGEVRELLGEGGNRPQFGTQFKAIKSKSAMPATAGGTEKYLESGLIKGIGPVMASRLVKKFGLETLEVTENEPARLTEVEGIGPERVQMFKEAWEAQKEKREVMVLLQGHGLSPTYAAKISSGGQATFTILENINRTSWMLPQRIVEGNQVAIWGKIMTKKVAKKMAIINTAVPL
jgi:hypothetical protein